MNPVLVEVGKSINIAMEESKCDGMRALIFLCFMICLFFETTAQGTIQEDPAITRMLDLYALKNKSRTAVKAWKIQVAASSDRRKMENEKDRFGNIYPYLRLELVHDNPYYILKLRDIAYREKIDALHLLHRIKRRYPAAILVLDDVKPETLLTSEKYR